MSDITDGGVAKVNCKFRDDGVIEIELPIVGYKSTKETNIGSPKPVRFAFRHDYSCPATFTKGTQHGKNGRTKISITGFNGGADIKVYHCLYDGWSFDTGEWDQLVAWGRFCSIAAEYKGILSPDMDVTHDINYCSGVLIYPPSLVNTDGLMSERTDSIVIDWTETLEAITNPTSPNYLDPLKYRILAYDGAVDPALWKIMDKTKKESIIDNSVGDVVADIQSAYTGVNTGSFAYSSLDGKKIAGSYTVGGDGRAVINSNDSYSTVAIKEGSDCYYTIFHPYIKLFIVDWTGITLSDWKEEQILAIGDEDGNITGDNIDDADKADETDNTASNSGSHTTTGSSGIHRTTSHYNDYKTSFDVTYLSSGNYNNFVSGGGGVISDSIVHANDQTLFIESINLLISGSSMTVIQLEEFDSTLKLVAGEKIYGYIINSDGDVQPRFSGYVSSISRRLGANGQEIVYNCKDWKYYFNQLYTPMIYQKKGYLRNIVNDLLIKAGITNFTNNLPNLTVTVKYQANSIMSVLDWACSIAGDYWFWIDINGKLNINKINGATHSFRVPTIGETIGTNKVVNFDGLSDLSNSRSRIVISGGSGSKIYEKAINSTYSPSQHYNSIQEAIDEGGRGEIGIFKQSGTTTNTKTYLVDDGNFHSTGINTYSHSGDNHVWYKNGIDEKTGKYKYYWKKTSWTLPEYDHYYIYRKRNVKFFSEMIAENRTAWTDHYYCAPNGRGKWTNEGGVSIQNDTVRGDSVVYVHRDHCIMEMHFAEKRLNEDLTVYIDTGNSGGTYLYKNASFRYVQGLTSIIDDTPLMSAIAANLSNYYKPIYGGTLTLVGLRTELELGQRITLTNTSLPATEAENLKIFDIRFDIATQTTQVGLSTRINTSGTSIDPEIIKENIDYYRRALADNNNFILRTTQQY